MNDDHKHSGFEVIRLNAGNKCPICLAIENEKLRKEVSELKSRHISSDLPTYNERLEPDGGNMYRPHPLMIHSGRFWRCAHGNTGFNNETEWIGCEDCKNEDIEAFNRFHRKNNKTRK